MMNRAMTTSEANAASARAAACDQAYKAAFAEAYRVEMVRGAAAERVRIRSILTSPEAQHRGDMARHLALETDMSAAAAVAMLGKAPKAAAGPMNPLARHLFGQGADHAGDDGAYDRGRLIVLRTKGK